LQLPNFLKWLATSILVVGTVFNALGYYPLGPFILATGGYVWLIVAIMWKDAALIITNAVMSTTGLALTLYTLYYA
jgi:hypothetical protein